MREKMADGWLKDLLIRRGPLVLFALLLAYLAIFAKGFWTASNLEASLIQAAPIAIVSYGLAVVIIGGGDDIVVGGIDLSLPASAALGTAIVADGLANQGWSLWFSLLLALAVALLVGVINAILVSGVGLSAILTTLATYATVVGVIRVYTSNRRITVGGPTIEFLREGRVLGIPVPVLIMLAAFVVFYFIVHRTKYGMRLQAVGGSAEAARTSGINPNRYLASAFPLAALAAAIATVPLVARGSGMSPGIDEQLMIDMVLAAFLGASFSARNVVTIYGALLGAVLVALLSNGLILLRVDNSWIDGVKGALILIVVASASLQNRVKS